MARRPRSFVRLSTAAVAAATLVTGLLAAGTAPAPAALTPIQAAEAPAPTPEVVKDIDSYATGLTWHDGRIYTITSEAIDAEAQTVLSVDPAGAADQTTPIPEPPAFTATALTVAANGSFYFNGYDLPAGATEARYGLSYMGPDGSNTFPRTRLALPYRESHGLIQDGRRLYFLGAHDLPQTTDGYVGRLGTNRHLDDQEDPDTFLGGVETAADCHPAWSDAHPVACMSQPTAFAFVGDQVWVADSLAGVITVFDQASGAVVHRYGLGHTSPADKLAIGQAMFDTLGALAGDEDGNAYIVAGTGGSAKTYKVTSDGVMHRVSDDAAVELVVDPASGDLFALKQLTMNHFQIIRYAGTAGLGRTTPGVPTDLSTAYGFEAARVSFTAPADDGNDPIIDYRVTAHLQGSSDPDDTVVAWGESSPVVVAGIDEGTWELTVQAENSVGFGEPAVVTQAVQHVEAVLDVSPTSGTAPFFATLDASGSAVPPGATLKFHCGDTFAPPQVAADGRSAQCKYNNASPSQGFRARVTMADPVSGITLSDEERVQVAGEFVPSVNLQADVDSGTAPLTVHFDASDSAAPEGATFEFHCGDSHDVDQAYSADRTATCRYDRESPDGGWNAFVRMRDPATGQMYESTVPITVAPAPHTVDGSAAFDSASPLLDVTVASDGSLNSDTCGGSVSGVYCATLYGVAIKLAAGSGTFRPGTHVQVFAGDADQLQGELGDDVQVQGGFAVTWTPKQDLVQPLVVTIPRQGAGPLASRAAGARSLDAFSFDPLGFLGGVAQGIADGAMKVVQTAGSIIQAAANAISSLWNSGAQSVHRPNSSDTNDVLTCAAIGRDGDGNTLCQGPFTWQKDVPTTGMQALTAGSRVIAAGAGNVIASGGGNVIAAGGGNVIAAGGGNLRVTGNAVIAAGGGNVIAAGGGNVIAAGGGNVIAAGGGNLTMTLTRDPGIGFAEPVDPTLPAVTASVEADRAAEGGVYPEGTAVTVHLHASSPAVPAPDILRIDYTVDGDHPVAHTIAPGDSTDIVLDQPGDYTITYSAQDTALNEAAPQTQRVRIAGAMTAADQTISFASPSGVTYGDGDFAPHPSASSGLPVSVVSSTKSVCSIVGGKVHILRAGVCTLVASQPGDGMSWNPASDKSVSFVVARASLTVQAASASAPMKGKKPQIAPLFSGFVRGDSIFSLDRVPFCKAVRGKTKKVRRHGKKVKIAKPGRTTCSGAADANYTIRYRSGRLKVAKNGYAVTSASRAYLLAGWRTTFKLAATGKKHTFKVKGRLPSGLRLVHNKSWSRAKITGTPKARGHWTVTVMLKKGKHTKARQRLTIEID